MSENNYNEPWQVIGDLPTDKEGTPIHLIPDRARRIVAAVNACAGISTKNLEQVPKSAYAVGTMEAVINVINQRDQLLGEKETLLAACRKAHLTLEREIEMHDLSAPLKNRDEAPKPDKMKP